VRLTGLEGRVCAALSARLNAGPGAPLAVALSGGSDSTALLGLAATWASREGRPLLAVTVDHGLNPESAGWTERARRVAEAAGARWTARCWAAAKPASGLPAAARAARHALIAEAAREAGARVVLFGHTADDLDETRLMRRHGSTTPDAAPWSPSPAWPEGRGVFILRPLLGERRAELRSWLASRGEAWLDDPANDDQRFARARARCDLAAGAAAPPLRADPAVLGRIGAETTPDGRIVIPRGDVLAAGARLIARAAVCAAGSRRPPRQDQLRALLARLAAGGEVVATLAGSAIEAAGDTVVFARDAGERARGGLAPLPLVPGVAAVWDGRFLVRAGRAGRIVPAAGRLARLGAAARAALQPLSPKARAALPAFEDSAGEIGLPRPFGEAPARAHSLVGARFAAACGWIERERDIVTCRCEDGAPGLASLS
jgi:tRNA(Ile)-lysidine synthase